MNDLSPSLLLVEDDHRLAELVADFLSGHGYRVSVLHDGRQVIPRCRAHMPDLVILDVMLPGVDGFTLCRQLRTCAEVPVLMLTARGEDEDQVHGLDLGADDYVIKPVEPRVLLARVRALLRRKDSLPEQTGDTLHFGSLTISRATLSVTLDNEAVDLAPTDFELLWVLARHAGRTVSRDQVLNALRGIDFDGLDRSVDMRISRLRRRLGDSPKDARRIKTVWGKGYQFIPDGWDAPAPRERS